MFPCPYEAVAKPLGGQWIIIPQKTAEIVPEVGAGKGIRQRCGGKFLFHDLPGFLQKIPGICGKIFVRTADYVVHFRGRMKIQYPHGTIQPECQRNFLPVQDFQKASMNGSDGRQSRV